MVTFLYVASYYDVAMVYHYEHYAIHITQYNQSLCYDSKRIDSIILLAINFYIQKALKEYNTI